MSNSPLVQYTRISPNCNSPRVYPIRKITIHHVAGVCSVETLGEIFAPTSRQASSNYGIGSDGRIGMYCEEINRSWCSSSYDNDQQAITIEVSNSTTNGWLVSDYVLSRLIDLCTDICKRNGISQLNFTGDANGNLTAHRYFAQTSCPGDYLYSKFPYIADEVNKRLKPHLSVEDITNKKVVLKIDANLWNLDFNNYDEAKVVKSFKKGDIIEVSAIARHSIGSSYYLTEYSYSKGIMNGFNVLDCEDYTEPTPTPEPTPVEEPKEEPAPVVPEPADDKENTDNTNTLPIPDTNPQQDTAKSGVNIINIIIQTIIKIIGIIFKGGK